MILNYFRRSRITATTDELDFDNILQLEPNELLDNSFARHKMEMAKLRHQSQSPNNPPTEPSQKKVAKIALKSAEELQSSTSDQLALLNREYAKTA